MSCRSLCLGVICWSIVLATSAQALDFEQMNVQPVYQFEIFPSSGFIKGDENVTLDFEAFGSADISINDEDIQEFLNDMTLPIPLAAVSGTFEGEMPAGTILPEGTPFTLRALELVEGELSNVTVDDQNNINGADVTVTLLFSHDIFVGMPDEIRLFGDEMTFTGEIDSVPFSVGTSLVSPEPVGLYRDSLDGEQVGLVKNRFLNIVPEPTSLSLLVLCGLAAASLNRRSIGKRS